MRLLSGFVSALVCLTLAATAVTARASEGVIPTPTEFFGFEPGSDRRLVTYEQLLDYLEAVAEVSPRVTLREVGRSTLDRPMMLVFISSETNLQRLEELREINRRLALDPVIPEDERAELIEDGRAFIMATLSMHSTEVGPAQTLPLLAHQLAAAEDPETVARLDDVVLMVVASLNPDGMDMVVDYYRETLGTEYEGATMPGLYHHYVGHDNNRDFVTLSQAESRVVSRLASTEWYPQVLVDKHQMGRTGPRYFVPRYHDPIAENVDGELWTWTDVFGSAMAREMAEAGLSGVASHWVFDDYWPGSTTTPDWKGVIGVLTEAASCRVATPVFIEKSERRVNGKGLSEYEKSVNMPNPWPGGWWRLGDIIRYELASWQGLLETASRLRAELLSFRNELCRREVARGRTEAPFYYVIPVRQHDRSERGHLVSLLLEHGVEVSRLTGPVLLDERTLDAGDVVVPLAQPYRSFVKEVMEHQRYPVRHYTPDGDVIRPYDITSWSLPLHMGVESFALGHRSAELEAVLEPIHGIDAPATARAGSWGLVLDPRDNASYPAVFDALAQGAKVRRAVDGVTVGEITLPAGAFVIENPSPELLAGKASAARSTPLDSEPAVELRVVARPRVALMETWFHDMDAGWTRFLLERSGVEHTVLRPADVAGRDLARDFDVVIFPDAEADLLLEGKFKDRDEYRVNDYPPKYRSGLGDEGKKRLQAFLRSGGRVVAWGESTGVFLDALSYGDGDQLELELPVHDDANDLEERGLYVPGAALAVELLPDHPLTWGLPPRVGVFTRGRPVLGTSPPLLVADRRVVGTFPERDILLSGYAEEVDLLAGRPAAVWARVGRGQLVLFGFHPQFRASTPVTYKLLYNAILLPRVTEEDAGVAGDS